MADFNFEKMQEIQKELQERYKEKWRPLNPDKGKDTILWMMIEAGEIADILKKEGNKKVMEDTEVRKHFIEEMCDTLMYFNDLMLCYQISPEELEREYLEKHDRNMNRWYKRPEPET